ncbi:MAG: hypothetical protein FJ279_19365 [Planctomycetes bacterium]|nr:hypothetical protein [Planctomycetota bacterium]MBM4080014.1 hypothetical protein [Planctomycetota bacterium]
MADKTTLEQVEQLAARLPLRERRQLLGRQSEQLRGAVSRRAAVGRGRCERHASAILRECDHAAAPFTRKTDSAETLRRIRDQRHRQICQSES